MEMSLKVIGGSQNGKEIRVAGPKFFIGRAEDCNLRPNSDSISRHHCVLLLQPGSASVRDFGSRNGTYVNDERITGECAIHNGDKLVVGTLKFEIVLTANVSGKKKPAVTGVADVAARLAAGSGGAEDQIGQWLAPAGSDDKSAGAKPTASIAKPAQAASVSDTATSNTATDPLKKTVEMPRPVELPAQPIQTADKLFGKLTGKTVASGTRDSREAATEMLKKMFDNR